MLPSPVRSALPLLAALFVSGFLTGCAVLAVPDAPVPPEPEALKWEDAFLREHLRFFNGTESAGRGTASAGFARVAAYVGARMRQFGLQPGLHDDFRLIYQTPVNVPVTADLVALGADTLRFQLGVDFVPDARSDSGSVTTDRVDVLRDLRPLANLEAGSPIAVIPSDSLAPTAYAAIRGAGYRGLLLVGPLRPNAAPRPVRGLLIEQISPETAKALLINWPDSDGNAHAVRLRDRITMRVIADFHEAAGAVNVLGFLGGKHPVHREELVIVCADLDAVGGYGGAQATDPRSLGADAAALLELVRVYGILSRLQTAPERTVLFAVFSGSHLGNAGLRAYLQHPLWEVDKTVSVVYVGLPAHREKDVRNLLAPFNIPLFAISPSGDSPGPATALSTDAGRGVDGGGNETTSDRPRTIASLADAFNAAVIRARRLAASAHEVIHPLTTGFGESFLIPITESETAQ
ncbi:MAG TPA: hypothetical protein VF190_07200 [Rhodothermales bacterium]